MWDVFSFTLLLPPSVTSSQSVLPPPPPFLAPVLVSAVPNERHEVPGAACYCLDGGEIFRRQLQVRAAATQTVADVLPRPCDAQPAAHDDPAHRRAVQHETRRHAGHWAVTSLGNSLQGDEEVLEKAPATPRVDHVLVLREGGGVKLRPGVWLCLPQITLWEKTSSWGEMEERRS